MSQVTGCHIVKTSIAHLHATDLETGTLSLMSFPVASISYSGMETILPHSLGTPTASTLVTEKELDPSSSMESSTAPAFSLETLSGSPRSPRHHVNTHVIVKSTGQFKNCQNVSNSLSALTVPSSPVNTCLRVSELRLVPQSTETIASPLTPVTTQESLF